MNRSKLIQMLEKHEGCELTAYRDTVGKLTIGIGRNLDDKGISRGEALMMLSNDIGEVEQALEKNIPWWARLNDTRQRVLADMAFNMGINGLLKFRKMMAALDREDYETAAAEMLGSVWAGQVKGRAVRLANMMRTGADPDWKDLAG